MNFQEITTDIKSNDTSINLASVTVCLGDHNLCTGKYTDSIRGNFIITCLCSCHFKKKKTKQKKLKKEN